MSHVTSAENWLIICVLALLFMKLNGITGDTFGVFLGGIMAVLALIISFGYVYFARVKSRHDHEVTDATT